MPDLAVTLGVTTAVCWGSADYLSKGQSARVGYYKTAVFVQLVTFVFLALTMAAVAPRVVLPAVPTLVLVCVGALSFLAFLCLYRAFDRGVVSVVAPVAYTYPAVTTILSVVLLGTALARSTAAGIACVILGVVLLSARLSEVHGYLRGGSSPSLVAGLRLAIAASFLFGLIYVGVGYATLFVGYALPPVILRGVGVAVGLAVAPLLGVDVRPSRGALSRTVLLMGLLESVGFLSFNYGVSVDPASLPVIASLSSLGGAVTSSYAMVFLKERLEPNQVIGLLLALAGVSILVYLGG